MPDTAKILVVDDLSEKLFVYQTILEELGQEVFTAHSGTEALRLVLQHDFAVVLLDVNMPDMDGFETAALIRGRPRSAHTPIIFLTAYADEIRVNEAYARGAVDFILTPVVPEVLRAKVRVFVDLFLMTQQVKRRAEEQIVLAEERLRRTAAEEANRRLGFLARAGAEVGQSLDPDLSARHALEIAVPTLADEAWLVQFEPGGERRAAYAVSDVGGVEVHHLGPDERLGSHEQQETIDRVLAAGHVQYLLAGEPVLRDARLDTVALPLKARGETCGTLVLSRRISGGVYSPADIATAEAFASRCAIAMENARLFRDVEQANRQKNEFLSMLAHELRNPLAPIRNAVSVLRLSGESRPESNWAQDVIDRQVKQLVRLVDDLLDVSRITSGKIRLDCERLELSRVLQSALETSRPLIEAAGHHFHLDAPTQPIWVHGDHARLSQVLSNLLNNAAKYTPQGGSIWLSARLEEGVAAIRVRDTGVGIAPEMLPRVFELFTQIDQSLDRSQGGLGIGLTLVQRLVAMHGGSVHAASAGVNRGSEFTVRLPTIPAPVSAVALEPAAPAAASAKRRRRVLVVDDNRDTAQSLGQLLRVGGGHEIATAFDGLAALEEAAAFRPDSVILDLGLPGLNGFEVAQRLRSAPETSGLLLIAVSGYGQPEDQRRSREAGFDHHFTKPVDYRALLTLLAAPMPERAILELVK